MSNNNNLPIDIQYKKMLDWLIDRGLLYKTWNKNYKRVKNSIAAALSKESTCKAVKDYLENLSNIDENTNSSSDSESISENFTFFHANKVFDLYLAYCKDDSNERTVSKSLFNNYNDADLSTWDNITHAYKKNNIYMGEAARVMKQNTVYEIPALKKNIARVDKRIGDIDRKIAEYEKSITESKQNLISKCKELKIKGINYRPELTARAVDLVPALNNIQKDIQNSALENACEFYTVFSNYIFDPTALNEEMKEENKKKDIFGTIFQLINGKLIENNNNGTTSHEITMGDVSADIDWGNMMDQLDGTADVSSNAVDPNAVDIDWSSMLETTSGDQMASAITTTTDDNNNDNAVEIDWSSMVEIESEGASVGTGSNSNNNLLSSNFRQNVMNELMQLKTFYVHRIFEMSDESENSNSLLTSGDSNLPILIRNSNISTMKKYLKVINEIMDAMKESVLQQLLAIHSGGGAFDRIVNSLQAIDLQISKLGKLKDKILDERSILSQETRTCRSKVQKLVKETVQLKSNIENALSKHYKGRNVKIVGDINSLLM